jgi:hypothetical protein
MHLIIDGKAVCDASAKGGGVPQSMWREVDCIDCLADTMYELARAAEFVANYGVQAEKVRSISSLTIDESLNFLERFRSDREINNLPPL